MTRDRRRHTGVGDERDHDTRGQRDPGKVSLTQRLAANPGSPSVHEGDQSVHPLASPITETSVVQLAADDPFGLHLEAADVQRLAATGVNGSGKALPHADRIQASFGSHDIGGVRAHVGGDAADAAQQIGARAYATGTDVAFAETPDLHTAAHEAAHVVQQRAGVHLKGGVGQAGDRYEQHADAVADAVVRGESAEPLLHECTGTDVSRSSPASGAAVQRHTESEHKAIGDAASGKREMVLEGGMHLSFGDVVAMGGDYFGGPGELLKMANTPGNGPGTREEVHLVLVKIERDKHAQRIHRARASRDRAAEQAAQREYDFAKQREESFSPTVRAAVDARFLNLARNNEPHFLDNDGDGKRDPSKVSAEEWQGYLRGQLPTSAPAGYRLNHLQAISKAREAGKAGKSLDEALFFEAFGAHYLTDSFAGGHTRTARRALTQNHEKMFPLFFTNLTGYIAEQIAEELGDSMYFGALSEDLVHDGISVPGLNEKGAFATVKAMLDQSGGLSFGDLVSGVHHDYDNHFGVRAKVGGAKVTLKGDGHIHEGDQFAAAKEAVTAGIHEVSTAYGMGKNGLSFGDIFAHLTTPHGGLFLPERLLPEVLPDAQQGPDQQQLPTNAKSVEELLASPTFRQGLSIVLAEKAGMLEASVQDLKVEQRNAVKSRIIKRMRGGPDQAAGLLRDILHFVPDTGGGLGGHDMIDDVLSYLKQVKKTPGGMESMTLEQRKNIYKRFFPPPPGKSALDRALREVLETAPPDQRAALQRGFIVPGEALTSGSRESTGPGRF